ncbi:hypothetical protein ACFQI7_12615 [Paenibacillus allorhizosphaerae]|uniref:Uncharacterized protein n=1 Tax=Paenibacillus allorhizosphaerae TaxID=2849866 RepID=A0ABM8VLD5_9BACL|nr:hypothetical protein [Paenibacillus allorhizosphaerae]CAG7648467.1 hypothetical protein PAECIP111802_04218 [Paenibacillus allorhizosphaerae]
MSKCITLTAYCSILIVISGCGTAGHASSTPDVSSAQAATSPNKPADVQKRRPDGDLLSLNERQMVLFFKDLLQIDRKEGLGFTRDQAEEMLPLVRKNSISGELTQSDQAKIVEMLTTEQKHYYDEIIKRLPRLGMNPPPPPPHEHISPEELERKIEEFERRRRAERGQEAESAADNTGGRDNKEGSLAPNGGKSVEKMLIELLESKLAP